MAKAKEKISCPLCNQTINRTGRPPKRQKDSLGRILVDVMDDVSAWAEGDVIANDGITLKPRDLARYLAERLTPALMNRYEVELARRRGETGVIGERIAEEQRAVAMVAAGEKPPHMKTSRIGRPKKEFCIRGHRRTPENIASHGRCRQCTRDQAKQMRDLFRQSRVVEK